MSNEVTKLEDIIPTKVYVTLNVDGEDELFEMKKWDISDEVWCQKRFNKTRYELLANNVSTEDLLQVLFHVIKDKSRFAASKEKTYDDDGVVQEKLITAPEKIGRAMKTTDYFTKAVNQLIELFKVSDPAVKKAIDDAEAKAKAKKK